MPFVSPIAYKGEHNAIAYIEEVASWIAQLC